MIQPILFVMCILLTFGVGALNGQTKDGSVPLRAEDVCPLKPGMTVPDVAVADLSGKPVRLVEAVRDQRTVIVF